MAGTIKEIAELAGVSRGTVDRALNNRGRVKADVAQQILEIADEIGYVPRRLKKTNSKEKHVLGVITQLENASFMVQIHRGIEEAKRELASRGIELVIIESVSVDEKAQLEAIETLAEQKIAGLAIMPVDSDAVRVKLNSLVDQGVTVITFNSDIVGTKRQNFVGLNNKQSGRTAAGLMAMLTGKKGKVLLITGYFSNSVSNMRVEGFVEEMKLSYPELELAGVHSSFDNRDEVERIVTSAMESFPDLKGIVVFSGGQGGVTAAFEKLKVQDRPAVIVYDQTEDNERGLRDNHFDFLIDQDGYTQGYRSLLLLANAVQLGVHLPSEYIYTDIRIKTKYNI